jgi:hypothetical protein
MGVNLAVALHPLVVADAETIGFVRLSTTGD